MSRILVPILILLWSLLYSWFWNCGFGDYQRRSLCNASETNVVESSYAATQEENTQENSANLVDSVSATAADENLTEEEKLLFNPIDVYFPTGQSDIKHTTELDTFLATAKDYLKQNPDKKLSLTGHTDSDGSHATNEPLSKRRAQKVKAILINSGFNADQLSVFGLGETQPVADNATAAGKAKNRRVSIRLMD